MDYSDTINLVPRKYRHQVEEITKGILAQRAPFKRAVERGVKQASTSKQAAREIVYFLGQLQTGVPRDEVIQLLEQLKIRVEDVLKNAKEVQKSLSKVRKGLFQVGSEYTSKGAR